MTRRLAREDMSWLERRHAQRLGLGPYYAGLVTFVVGHLSWPFIDYTETWIALTVLVALALFWILTRLSDWTRWSYGLVCLACATGWVWWLHYPLPPGTTVGAAWALYGAKLFWLLVAVHVLGIGWWTSKFKRTQVHLEDDLRGWQEIASHFGMGMTSRHITKKEPNGNEAGFLVWERGTTTVKAVMDRREQLEGAMGLPEGTLRLMKHSVGKRSATDRVDYVSFLDDPLDKAVDWPGPQRSPDGGDLSVDVPCEVGIQEDGEIGRVPYYEREINAVTNKLLGGSQGSGKSGGFTLHIVDITCRSDATQWGFDLKDGMEIAPFDAIMDNLACNSEEATEAIEALDAIMTYRGEENTRRGRKAWPVSPEAPLLVVWIDELHRLLAASNGRTGAQMRRCEEVLVRLATTGRALGISVNGATQNPTLEAMRTSQFRDRLNQRICFRTESAAHEGYIIPNRKVDAHLIPSSMPGMCYIQDRDRFTGMPVRYYRVTDEMVEAVLSVRAPGLPLDEGSRRAAMAVSPRYAARCAERYGDSPEQGQGAPVDPDPNGPVDRNGAVPDITPEPIPPYLQGPDVPIAEIIRQHRRLAGQAAAQPEGTVVMVKDRALDRPAVPLEIPEGEEAVFAILAGRKHRGASAKELWEGADRRKSWFHREVNKWLEAGRVAQPEGRGGLYYLPEHVPVVPREDSAQ